MVMRKPLDLPAASKICAFILRKKTPSNALLLQFASDTRPVKFQSSREIKLRLSDAKRMFILMKNKT